MTNLLKLMLANITISSLIISNQFVFAKNNNTTKEELTYRKCTVNKVIDGDTFYANCEINGKIEFRKIRLASVDTFEIKRYKRVYLQSDLMHKPIDEIIKEGLEVKKKVESIFSKHPEFTCIYFGKGIYGRDICAIVFDNGLDLSIYLRCNNLALPYMVRDIHKPYFKSCEILHQSKKDDK